MGRATRWLKGLFGITKNSKDNRNSNSQQDQLERCSTDRRLPCHKNVRPKSLYDVAEGDWIRESCLESSEMEQTQHAIAVAAATAAAADAAVAAARAAAAAVVVVAQQGRRVAGVGGRGSGEMWSAALKIQSAFRGYLARKALRALKGLVKLQAMVRGYLVRRQASTALQHMQSLMKAQATARSRRTSYRPFPASGADHQSRSRKSANLKRLDNFGYEPVNARRLSDSLDVRAVRAIHERLKIVEVEGRTIPSPLIPTKTWVLTPKHCRNSRDCDGEALFDSTTWISDSINSDRNFGGEWTEKRHFPSYMVSTKSSKAKSRSASAPRQRPRFDDDTTGRLSFHEMIVKASRSSVSRVRAQRSGFRVPDGAVNFESAGKLDRYE